jgi:hypothetical protein
MERGEGTFFLEPWERLSLQTGYCEFDETQPALSRISGILVGNCFFCRREFRMGELYVVKELGIEHESLSFV